MNPLGLSDAAKDRRKKFITASDAKMIVEGGWPECWRRKMGYEVEPSLDDELRVQMGSFTEPFGLWWYEKMTGREVGYFSDNPIARACWAELTGRSVADEFVVSKKHPWMGCSLDAVSTTSKGFECVLDQKHVGQFRYDELVERYTAAGTHQAIVCNVDWWCLSVFVGNSRWELVEQECDPFYVIELIEKEREFWSWVERGEEPPDMSEPVAPPKPQPKLRNIAMPAIGADDWAAFVGRNNWAVDCANAIEQFGDTEGAFKAHGAAREQIKKLVPDDCGMLSLPTHRGLFTAKRSTAGALTMTIKKEK